MPASKFQHLKQRYQQLAPREQKALFYGSIFVVIFIVYQFIWSPLDTQADYLRKQVKSQQSLLSWMQVMDNNIKQANASGTVAHKAVTPVVLLTDLQKRVAHDGLGGEVKELKQTSNDTVTLRMQKISFDKLMKMLMAIEAQYIVTVTQLSVMAGATPGVVDVTVGFKC